MKKEKVHIGNSFVNNTAQRPCCLLKSCQVLTVTHMAENNICIFFNGVQKNIYVILIRWRRLEGLILMYIDVHPTNFRHF